MLTDCPACKKKISDKAETCPHCDFAVEADDADAILEREKRKRYDQHQSLQTQSFVAVLVFITGFGLLYWGQPEVGGTQHSIGMLMLVLGFLWYVVNRARIAFIKAKRFKF